MSAPTFGALSPGWIFHGRYEIVRCLRAGGMGAVYECIHLPTRKHRALKVMLPQLLADAGLRERFELEARVTADIESDHIVETFDAGVDDQTGVPFLVMELLRGEDLSRVLARRGALPAGEVVLLLSQAALALDKTHAAGIVHRDLKPANLYLTTRDDGSPRLKILDFGIAKLVADSKQTAEETAMVGTPVYMPPEQIRGQGTLGSRADLYALGHIAFTLLTGKAYWDDEQKASPAMFTLLEKVVKGLPEPATSRAARRGVALPAAFDAWFARATAGAASDRFDRASTLVNELAVVLGLWAPRSPVDSGPHGFIARASQAAFGSGPSAHEQGAPPTPRPAGAQAQTGLEGKTESTVTKSIGGIAKRSSLPLALAALGVLTAAVAVVVAIRLLPARSTPRATATAAAVDTQAGATTPEDLAPAAQPSVLSALTLPAAEPSASAASVPASPIVKPAPLTSSTAPAPPKSPGMLVRLPVAVKPPAGNHGCDPPYVIDGVGHRHIKPQCL